MIDLTDTGILKLKLKEMQVELDAATGAYKSNMQAAAMSAMLSDKVRCLELRNKELQRELYQQRFNNKHNLSIDQKISDEIAELQEKLDSAVKYLIVSLDKNVSPEKYYDNEMRMNNWLKQNTNTSK